MKIEPTKRTWTRATSMREADGYPELIVVETRYESGRAKYCIRRPPNEFTGKHEIEISCAELEALIAFRNEGKNER